MKTQHTPVPWSIGGFQYKDWRHSGEKSRGIIILANPNKNTVPNTIAEILESNFNINFEANAEFIVRACNSHDQLLESCEQMLWILNDPSTQINGGRRIFDKIISNAKSALEAAKGEA